MNEIEQARAEFVDAWARMQDSPTPWNDGTERAYVKARYALVALLDKKEEPTSYSKRMLPTRSAVDVMLHPPTLPGEKPQMPPEVAKVVEEMRMSAKAGGDDWWVPNWRKGIDKWIGDLESAYQSRGKG